MAPTNTTSPDYINLIHDSLDARLKSVEEVVAILPHIERSLTEVNNRLSYISVLEERDRQYRDVFTELRNDRQLLQSKFEEFSDKILTTINSFKDRELNELRRQCIDSIREQKEHIDTYTIKPLQERLSASESKVNGLNTEVKVLTTKVNRYTYTGAGIIIALTIIWGLLNSRIYDRVDQMLKPAAVTQQSQNH